MIARLYGHATRLLIASFSVLFCLVSPAVAQQEEELQPEGLSFNAVQYSEQADNVRLAVQFNLVDVNDEIVFENTLKSAQFRLNEMRTPADYLTFQQEVSDVYVVLALDMSGSMSGDVGAMKQAAMKAIGTASDNTRFMVLTFADEISTNGGFVSPESASDYVNRTINNVKPNAGTKLYDGVYRAIDEVNTAVEDAGIPGQRAIILFSDGKDEQSAGQGQYSEKGLSDVINASLETGLLPIHSIGFRDSGNALKEISRESGGRFAQATNATQLDEAFASIMNGLNQQWLATGQLYPETTGVQQMFLEVEYEDKIIIGSFDIEITQRYTPPSILSDIQMSDVVYDVRNDQYEISVVAARPDRIGLIEINLEQGGKNLDKQLFETIDEIKFDVSGLMAESYQLELRAYDLDGQPIKNAEGGLALHLHEVDHTPPPPYIEIDSFEQAEGYVIVKIRTENTGVIDRFRLHINDPNSNKWYDETVDFFSSDKVAVEWEANAGEAEAHTFIVEGIGSDDSILFRTEKQYTHTPPPKIRFFKRIGNGFRGNPVLSVILVGLIFLVVGWLMAKNLLDKSQTSTPNIITSLSRDRSQKPPDSPMNLTQLDQSIMRLEADQVDKEKKGKNTQKTHSDLADPDALYPVQRYVVISTTTLDRSLFSENIPQQIHVTEFPLIIGRDGTNNDLNTLLGKQVNVSRQQAKIQFGKKGLSITALKQNNSVYVNDEPLTPSEEYKLEKDKPYMIRLTRNIALTLYGHEKPLA